MSDLTLYAGTTSKIVRFYLKNSSTGNGLTGLAYNTGGLTIYYTREGDTSSTAVSLSLGVLGTWSSGGFKEVDSTHMSGLYEFGIPNAAITGVNSVVFCIQGAANLTENMYTVEIFTDPVTLFRQGAVSVNPNSNTYDEIMTLIGDLILGNRVNVSSTEEQIYSSVSPSTLHFVINYEPSISTPLSSTTTRMGI